jgi:predicted acylesterase/phospholipase RssA
VCRALGADAVVAVDINLRKGPPGYRCEKKTLKIFDILANSLNILEKEVTRCTIAAQAPDVCVQPAVGDIFTLDFRMARPAIEAGYAAADERRAEIEALVERGRAW